MKKQDFQSAERMNSGILSNLEKQTLAWLAAHTPSWVNSDHLTILGLVALSLAGLCYWISRWEPLALFAGIVCLALNWLGDSLDGTLARYRNAQRPRYGFYVDHIIDAFGTLFLLNGLALSGYMSPLIAIGLLVVYLMLSIEVYLATYALGVFRLSFLRCGPTELRILLALGNLKLLHNPFINLLGHRVLLFDIGGIIAIVGMFTILVCSSVKNTVKLYKMETIA